MKDENRIVKAIDCLNWSEVDIELGQFLKGYSEGRIREDGSLQMLKLKDGPSPSASEEFLLFQRPEFLVNCLYLSISIQELGRGDSVTNLHIKMRDMVSTLSISKLGTALCPRNSNVSEDQNYNS
ncbi:hypothetical protein GH714_025841 [Hevea brasiliensis]|uniref:Uncharacterized protein n=1 Tax=Hevea brasiliensis TaxID=3981 RepID=A0A6A6M4N9_HEVBR|nr:hypothetical protein GH714_025841 [Hevea brasiliensis]